jgi:pilus assembly protein Flp/PilA
MYLRPIGAFWKIPYTSSLGIYSFFALLEAFMYSFTQRGQGLVEYAMIIMLVGIVVIVMLALFGSGVGNMFSNIIHNF